MATTESAKRAECPACGRDDFASRQGMKRHHNYAHGESIAGEKKECDNCGEVERVPPSFNEKNEKSFCSPECFGEYRSENVTGDDHWNYEGVTKECPVCGDRFKTPPSEADNRTTCSRDCYAKYRSDTFTGEDHPRWSGGPAPYGPGFSDRKKDQIRQRDGYECQDCGMSQEEHFEEFDSALHVHHLQKAREVADPAERNAAENLLTLCRPCHNGKWEPMYPLRPDMA